MSPLERDALRASVTELARAMPDLTPDMRSGLDDSVEGGVLSSLVETVGLEEVLSLLATYALREARDAHAEADQMARVRMVGAAEGEEGLLTHAATYFVVAGLCVEGARRIDQLVTSEDTEDEEEKKGQPQ